MREESIGGSNVSTSSSSDSTLILLASSDGSRSHMSEVSSVDSTCMTDEILGILMKVQD